MELMKQYRTEVEDMESERQELANAERLFDLPITMYPELLQVQKEMKGLEQVYSIYEEQIVSVYKDLLLALSLCLEIIFKVFGIFH